MLKNLPPIEEMHVIDTPPQVVEENSLIRFGEGDIPYNKSASQQQQLNMSIKKQLKHNDFLIDCLSDSMFRIANNIKSLGKHASMVQTQLELVAKSQMFLLMK